jgi:hypothetical protein
LGAVGWWKGGDLGAGVLGGDDRGGARWRCWGRWGGRAAVAASLGATTGVELGGDVGGGEHKSHFDDWRSYEMGITVLVPRKC